VSHLAAGGLDDLFSNDLEVALGDVKGLHAGEDEYPDPVVFEHLLDILQIEPRQPCLQRQTPVADEVAP
jgi:hypothetical protein